MEDRKRYLITRYYIYASPFQKVIMDYMWDEVEGERHWADCKEYKIGRYTFRRNKKYFGNQSKHQEIGRRRWGGS